MFEEFIGKKVIIIITCHDGNKETEYGFKVIDVNGTLIKVQDSHGKSRVINTISEKFLELQLQD